MCLVICDHNRDWSGPYHVFEAFKGLERICLISILLEIYCRGLLSSMPSSHIDAESDIVLYCERWIYLHLLCFISILLTFGLLKSRRVRQWLSINSV